MKNKLEKGDDMKRLLKRLVASLCAISFVLVIVGIASADLITWTFKGVDISRYTYDTSTKNFLPNITETNI